MHKSDVDKHTQTEKYAKGIERHLSQENVSAASDDICGNSHVERGADVGGAGTSTQGLVDKNNNTKSAKGQRSGGEMV